jgi:hypothetical protein
MSAPGAVQHCVPSECLQPLGLGHSRAVRSPVRQIVQCPRTRWGTDLGLADHTRIDTAPSLDRRCGLAKHRPTTPAILLSDTGSAGHIGGSATLDGVG